MSDSIIEKVCTSPHRWLIVTGVTFVIALLTCLPLVDELLEARAERADLRAELDNADQAIKVLAELEQSVGILAQELSALKQKAVSKEQVPELRKWLMDAARQSGCNLRRVNFAATERRRWLKDDSPNAIPKTTTGLEPETPFDLETRNVSISVTGSQAEVKAILKILDEDQRIKHARAVELKPVGRGGRLMQLEITISYYALVEAKQYV